MKRILFFSLAVLLIIAGIVAAENAAFAESSKVPVVVLFVPHATQSQKREAIATVGGNITREYNIINGVAAVVPPARIQELQRNPLVVSVDQDVEVRAVDSAADTQIRADQVWTAGDTGQGIPVAILDTGIDNTHPEFSGRRLKCHNEIFTDPNTCDDKNGHGTHVAGIAGAAGVNAAAKGVAPALSFYIDQVLNAAGKGTISGVIAGIDWATANGAKAISMSLGTSPISTTQPNCNTAYPSFTTAINNAVAAGVTVVAAAGNSGTDGVGAPGCISSTITVGAVDSTDTIASFSSQGGPLADHGIVAPGVDIFSSYTGGTYATLSGTSMATPFVSGTVALLLKASPSLSPSAIRDTLFTTACTSSTTPSCPTGTVPNTVYGHGRLDASRAYNAVASPASPDFSITASPSSLTIQQGSSSSSTVTVTSLNGFNSAVTLSLTGNPTGVTGSFSSNPVTPASGGSAASTLTINVDASTSVGSYTLAVTGASGSLSHTTTLTLTVASNAPDFSITASPNSLNIQVGSSGTSTVTVSSLNSFTSPVTLSTSPALTGVTTTFSTNPVTPASGGSAQSTLTVAVGSTAVAGTYTLTVTGTSSSLSHSTTITLTIPGSLIVSVITDKPTYTLNSWVYITVHVTDGSTNLGVGGATVTVTVTKPNNGGTASGSATTNSLGFVYFKYKVSPNAPTGTYDVKADASATGYNPGSGTTTFTVS